MGQSEEVECAVSLRRPLGSLRLAERNQRRLRRMNGQTVAGKALRQHGHDPVSVRLQLASDDKIIGKANQKASPPQPWLYLLLEPLIQDMMEEYMSQHGCNDTALYDPGLGMTYYPFFHDPGAQ